MHHTHFPDKGIPSYIVFSLSRDTVIWLGPQSTPFNNQAGGLTSPNGTDYFFCSLSGAQWDCLYPV